MPNASQWPKRTDNGYGLAPFTLLDLTGYKTEASKSLKGQLTQAKEKLGPNFPTPRKLLCTFFSEILWRITEKKIHPSSRDGSIKVVTGGFRTLEGGQMTTTTSCDGITNC